MRIIPSAFSSTDATMVTELSGGLDTTAKSITAGATETVTFEVDGGYC